MAEDRFTSRRREAGAPDRGMWSPGIGPLVLISLCGILLLGVLILGVTTGIGFLLAVPLVLLAVAAGALLVRGRVRKDVSLCPHCGRRIDYPEHMMEFDCPACGGRIEARDRDLKRAA